MKSKIRVEQEQMGIVYPLDIPECVTLNADDPQLREVKKWIN